MLIYPCDWQIPVIERPELFIKACAQSNLLFERIVHNVNSGSVQLHNPGRAY